MSSNPRIRRIALLSDGVHPLVLGGMQKHSYYLLRSLLSSGVEVLLYHVGGEGELAVELGDVNLDLFEEVVIPFPSAGGIPGSYLRASFMYSLKIADDLKSRGPVDFVYAQGFAGWALMDRKRKGEELPPIGVNFHGLEMFQRAVGLKQRLIQWMFKRPVEFNLRHADVAYSLGGQLTDILRAILPENRISEIPIAIEEHWIRAEVKRFPDDSRKLLFIGRYERRKGLEELNSVLRELEGANMEFHFIGPIDASKRLNQSNAIYHGKIMDADILKEKIDNCQALIVPSYSEGMPTVILEAMARGLVVYASDVGAVRDLVNEKRGRLMQAGSMADIRTALAHLEETPSELLAQMGESAVNLIMERYIWSRVLAITLDDMSERISDQTPSHAHSA